MKEIVNGVFKTKQNKLTKNNMNNKGVKLVKAEFPNRKNITV